MNLRRFEDIIATETADGIVAYHGRNLEVAELSFEAYQNMSPIDLLTNSVPASKLTDDDASKYLRLWQLEENPEVKSGNVHFGIKSLTLNVTQICNLKCTYCAAGGDGTYGDPVTRIQVEKTLPR